MAVAVITFLIWPMRLDMPQCYIYHRGPNATTSSFVGNGDRVANQGQLKLRMKSKDDDGVLVSSVFQVSEITRPLMSVSRICDQAMICIFEKTHARV